MLAYDSNILYNASKDCRFDPNPYKCQVFKDFSRKVLDLGKVKGCVIPETVKREVRSYLIDEYAHHCKVQSVDRKAKRFVERFTDKLIVRAMKDKKFLLTCTSMDRDKMRRIARTARGDWKIVAESFLAGDDVTLVSFDHNITDDYCKMVYKEVAKEVAEEVGVSIAKHWDALKPDFLVE